MSLGPLDVRSIIDHLRVAVPELKFVGGAADRAAIDDAPTLVTPAAYVILASEDVNVTPATGIPVHRTLARVDVIYHVRHYRDGQRGAAHQPELAHLVSLGRRALNQFVPTAPTGAVIEAMTSAGRALLLALRERDAFWLDPFETTYWGRP